MDKGATVSVFGLTISGGDAGNDGGYPGGGGLDNSGTLTVSDSVFSNNTAGAGGAIFNGSGGTLVVTGSTFIDNGKYVTAYGSGIFNENGATATVTGSTFTGNSGTGDGGGGIFNEVGGTLTVSGSIFTGNVLSGIVNGGVLTVSGSTFTGNSGAGGILNGGTLTVTDSTFTSNSSYNNGGGISSYGTVTVSDSTFSGNSTSGFGGGIANDGGTLTVSGSTFTGNSANIDGLGGGIYNGGALTVSDSTFTSNSANAYSGSGGGLWNYRTAILTNCTFTNNSAIYNGYAGSSGSGGGIASVAGSLTLNNTIVAGNQASVNPDFYGAYTGSHNLIGGNPLLGPLANNGGPTQTMALLPGSPAIDAGSNALAVDPTTGQPLAYDQRGPGFPRILGHSVDIGAYEFSRLSQTINFGPLAGQTYGVAPIALDPTNTSGLPVSFAVISGPATLSGSVLTVTGAGNVVVEASQAGNATYAAATPVDESFMVSPALLTITANPVTKVYGATLPTLTASFVGFVNGGTATSLTTQPVLTSSATASSPVLSAGYNISVSGASDSNYTFSYVDGTVTVTPASLTVTATDQSMTYGGTVPVLPYTYTGLVNGDASVVFSGSLVTTATSSSSVGDYPITVGTLAATGNYTVGTYNPSTLTIAKADITVTPYGVTYDGNVHNASGTSLNGLVINSAHTNAGTYTDSWTYTDPNGNYNSSTGIITDTIAKANASINATPFSVTYDGNFHTATGVVAGVNGAGLSGLTVSSAHTNAGTYADSWFFSDTTGNYNNASGTITDTIAKANANISVIGYNTFYNAVSHIAIGAVYGVNGVALSGLNLSNTVHLNVGTYTDVCTFTDTTGNYNNASGTVVDTITPSKSKMVRETVLVPKTTVVKATVLVPVVKEVKVVERVKVGNKWVKKTVLVPKTMMVKKSVLVSKIKMVKKTAMVRVYYR